MPSNFDTMSNSGPQDKGAGGFGGPSDSSSNPSGDLPGDRFLGLQDLESFKREFIDVNRGKPLFMIRFQNLQNMELLDFIELLREHVHNILDLSGVEFGFHYIDAERALLMGISPLRRLDARSFPNIDNAIGRFHEQCLRKNVCSFDFGVGRTQCNFVSNTSEIYDVIAQSSAQNLRDNLIRWSWTDFNKVNTYFSGDSQEAVIQPTVFFDQRTKMFNVKGGEVFVGGGLYDGYHQLISDIPVGQDQERIELLIFEKLIIACEKIPGVLKFNISPQTLLDTFSSHDRVVRLTRLLHARGLNPQNVRFEIVEKPYNEEPGKVLKEVCQDFFNYGITFAADDFGVKSQSHQVILDLGLMIKEFKLDPISFKFKADEDRTKFLDNLAFIAYCKRLADNREALITAEAVEDYDTLRFLMEHHIHQYQANMFCGKMTVVDYGNEFENMRGLSEEAAMEIFSNPELAARQKEYGNIFFLARDLGML